MGRRRFGKLRKLPSGRYQASFVGPSGQRQTAPNTFRTKTDADRWLVNVESDISRGVWLDEQTGRQVFGKYAEAYLRDSPDVGERWAETCTRNMRLHMTDLLDLPLIAISPAVVRSWHAKALAGNGGRTSIAQSYRFLRTVMNCAVRDGAIAVNPCQIRGAGKDMAKERPIASPAEIVKLVDAITPRYRAAVVLAAWCGLRRGEVCALATADVDLVANVVRVRRNRVELLESGRKFDKVPKTRAGMRDIAIPPHLRPAMVEHMQKWAGRDRFFRRPRRAADAGQCDLSGVRTCSREGRSRDHFSRSATHRTDVGGEYRGDSRGFDDAAGSFVVGGCDAVPARRGGPGPESGGRVEPVGGTRGRAGAAQNNRREVVNYGHDRGM